MTLASITAADLPFDDLREACRHWFDCQASQAASGGLPGRRKIDPVSLPRRLLPRVKMAEHKDGRWFYRLAGTAFRDLAGMELAGRRIEEVENEAYGAHLTDILDRARAEGRPLLSEADYIGPKRFVGRQVWRLLLPLASDDAADAHVMICAHWVDLIRNPPTSVNMEGLETGTLYAVRPDDPPEAEDPAD
jgi:hypothetical protein